MQWCKCIPTSLSGHRLSGSIAPCNHQEFDCGEFEKHERLLMARLGDVDDLFPGLPSGDPALKAKLKQWRMRSMAERYIVKPSEPLSQGHQASTCLVGIDPFRLAQEA
jgi:hypothetical protein